MLPLLIYSLYYSIRFEKKENSRQIELLFFLLRYKLWLLSYEQSRQRSVAIGQRLVVWQICCWFILTTPFPCVNSRAMPFVMKLADSVYNSAYDSQTKIALLNSPYSTNDCYCRSASFPHRMQRHITHYLRPISLLCVKFGRVQWHHPARYTAPHSTVRFPVLDPLERVNVWTWIYLQG